MEQIQDTVACHKLGILNLIPNEMLLDLFRFLGMFGLMCWQFDQLFFLSSRILGQKS